MRLRALDRALLQRVGDLDVAVRAAEHALAPVQARLHQVADPNYSPSAHEWIFDRLSKLLLHALQAALGCTPGSPSAPRLDEAWPLVIHHPEPPVRLWAHVQGDLSQYVPAERWDAIERDLREEARRADVPVVPTSLPDGASELASARRALHTKDGRLRVPVRTILQAASDDQPMSGETLCERAGYSDRTHVAHWAPLLRKAGALDSESRRTDYGRSLLAGP